MATDAVGAQYALAFTRIQGAQQHFQAHLKLADGSPLTIDVRPSLIPLSSWLPMVLLVQLTLLLICTWLAVRVAIRPLTRLAQAVDTLDPNTHAVHLDEKGPTEVAHAAKAFNAMRRRRPVRRAHPRGTTLVATLRQGFCIRLYKNPERIRISRFQRVQAHITDTPGRLTVFTG